jgi:HlyD family secretion protein
MLRLLEEQAGGIYVDDTLLTAENKQSWYALIGFVPQNINLIDGNFIENIAFGVHADSIDIERVKQVAQLAQLESLINSQPDKFYTQIGEGGLKISGGQRQRIGIARALYNNAQILIFDEATSALDSETEEMITESLRMLNDNKITTIVVAHRLQTLRYCDAIYKLDQGKLSDEMKYSDL